jgi:hypothetical protein
MSKRVLGLWKANLKHWGDIDPDIKALGPMAEMMLGNLTVTFTDDQVTIAGRGKGAPQVYTYGVDVDDDSGVGITVTRPDGRQGKYHIEFEDETNIIMRMTAPKKDVLVLSR